MAANEGVAKAVVNFYQDHSDSESYDLRPYILQVQILIGLFFGNVGLGQERMILKKFLWRRVTQDLRNGGLIEIGLSIAKLIKINVLLHQFLNLMFNLHYM